jgi:hypothetical protein
MCDRNQVRILVLSVDRVDSTTDLYRSFILRRRFRRRIEEALAAGVLIPGALEDGMGRGRRRDFGEKPKLWEVWVDEHGQVHNDSHAGISEADNFGKGEGKWEEIQVRIRLWYPREPIYVHTLSRSSSPAPPARLSDHRV